MPGDTSFRNVALLLRGEPFAVDESSYRHGVAARDSGGVISASLMQEAELRASSPTATYESAHVMRFQSGRYLQASYSDRLNLRDTDFTVEGWAKIDAGTTGGRTLVDFRGSASSYLASWELGVNASARGFFLYDGVAGTTTHWTGDNSLPAHGTWFHWAVVRSAGAITLYIDGVPRVTGVHNVAATHSTGVRIGQRHDLGTAFIGVMDDVRISRTSRYAGAFTPPARVFPERDPYWTNVVALLEAEDGLVDLSPTAGTWVATGSPTVADGAVVMPTGAYLTMTKAGLTVGGAGNGGKPATYSLEWEMEVTGSLTGNTQIFQMGTEAAGRTNLLLVDGRPRLDTYAYGGDWMAAGAISAGWHKYALVVDNWEGTYGVRRLFIDGVLVGTSASYVWDKRGNGNLLEVGPRPDGTPSGATIKFRRFRMTGAGATNDSGRAPNAGYLPRSGPFLRSPANDDPYHANTALVLPLNDNTFADRSPLARTPSNTTNASPDWYIYRSGYTSLLGANGLTLTYTSGEEMAFGTGDFTVEAWVRPTSSGGTPRTVLGKFTTWPSSVDFILGLDDTGKWEFYAGAGVPIALVGAAAAIGEWSHVAVVRQGGATQMRVNGVPQAQPHFGTVSIANTRTVLAVGANGNGANYFSGNISDVRITKGVARYPIAFTPAASLPNSPQGDSLYADVGLLLQAGAGSYVDRSTAGAAVSGAIFDTGDTLLRRNSKPVRMRSGDPDIVTASNAAQNLGTSDFTIEFWFYLGAPLSATQTLVSRRSAAALAGTAGAWQITCWEDAGGKKVRFETQAMQLVPAVLDSAYLAALAPINGWYFVSVQRSAATYYLHLNGRFMSSWTGSGIENLTGAYDVRVGPGQFYLHDLRITRGTTRYPISEFSMVPAAEADPFLDVTLYQQNPWGVSTAFGGPAAANQQRPSGFSTTEFGLAAATLNNSGTASGWSSTAFGTATGQMVLSATGLGSALSFGAARSAASVQATPLIAAVAFGTPVFNPNTSKQAAGLPAGTVFGAPWAVRGYQLGAAKVAVGIPAGTTWGAATATATRSTQASGASTTAYGSPVARRPVVAQGVPSTAAFGLASASAPGRAGLGVLTQIGRPAIRLYGQPQGTPGGRFGVPEAGASGDRGASGSTTTTVGAPLAYVRARPRSAVFRAKFGTAQVERP